MSVRTGDPYLWLFVMLLGAYRSLKLICTFFRTSKSHAVWSICAHKEVTLSPASLLLSNTHTWTQTWTPGLRSAQCDDEDNSAMTKAHVVWCEWMRFIHESQWHGTPRVVCISQYVTSTSVSHMAAQRWHHRRSPDWLPSCVITAQDSADARSLSIWSNNYKLLLVSPYYKMINLKNMLL